MELYTITKKHVKPSYLAAMDRVDVDVLGFGFKIGSPSKIGHKRAFSLPAGSTCPGKTEACAGCYAQKGNHLFPEPQNAFAQNYVTLSFFERTDDVMGASEALVDTIRKEGAPGEFRVHESGDFHSQFAVDVWADVARSLPRTKFWAYTRSFHLDFTTLVAQKNMQLWASTDPYNTVAATDFSRKFGILQAFGPYSHGAALPEKSFVCPVTSGKLSGKAACLRCRLCFEGGVTRNVVFLAH